MLSDAAQQSLPQDAQVALQQVDNRESFSCVGFESHKLATGRPVWRSRLPLAIDVC